MNWTVFGHIADVLAVISFILSLRIIHKITAKTETQKELYEKEREDLLNTLCAMRENNWQDCFISIPIQDSLETKIYEYQIKYILISSPRCIFHAFRCTHLLKQGITDTNSKKIRQDINFIIARLNKKE